MHNQILIVGGGAGGLELAARLGRRLGPRDGPRQVLLIDRAVFHLWKPSLHEVAAGSLDSRQEGLDYLTLARRNHFRFVLGEVEGLDPDARRLRLAETYDADGRMLIAARSLGWSWRRAPEAICSTRPARRSTPACWRMSRMPRPFTGGSPRSSCHPPMTVAIC